MTGRHGGKQQNMVASSGHGGRCRKPTGHIWNHKKSGEGRPEIAGVFTFSKLTPSNIISPLKFYLLSLPNSTTN